MNRRYLVIISLTIIFVLSFFIITKRIFKNFKDESSALQAFVEKKADPVREISVQKVKKLKQNLPTTSEEFALKQEQVKPEKEKVILNKFDFQEDETDVLKLNQQAQRLEAAGDFEGAIKKYKKAINLNRDLDVTYNNLGDLYYKKGDYALAVENFKKALKIKRRAAYYNNLGNVYYKKGEYSKAILRYEKALKIEPEAAYIYNNLGDAYLKKGSSLIAIKYLKKAILLKPDFFLAYRNLAQAYVQKGKSGEAEKILRQAIKDNQNELIFYVELANLYERQEKYEEELNLLNEYLIFNPGNEIVESKIKILEQTVYR